MKKGKKEYLRNIAGKLTIHEVTGDNGIRVCNVAMEMNMAVVSMKCNHKKEHKVTWLMPEKTKGIKLIMY